MIPPRVAVVGVGNCASALLQGIRYYSMEDTEAGLILPEIGGYSVADIRVVAAFDVDSRKVGRDLSEAISAGDNNVTPLCDVPPQGVRVAPGPVLDGLGPKYRERVQSVVEGDRDGVLRELRGSGAQIVVNYLPVGSRQATRWWADAALEADCAFVNCIPEFIASDSAYAQRFATAGLPLLGDDVKSQFGATLLHRLVVQHMEARGLRLDKTSQLNFGGNMDFYNMLDAERLESKRVSKREAVRSLQRVPIDAGSVHIGPSGHIGWLEDNKWCYLFVMAAGFAGTPIRLEAKLEVCDSPNSAGVVVDLIRIAKLALDAGRGGPLLEACGFYMKSPPVPATDDEALTSLREWLRTTRD